VIVGGIVKLTELEGCPATVTTTGPFVAFAGTGTTMLVSLHDDGVAGTPLNVTVLDPCDAPKRPPVIVTDVPAFPVVGDRLVMNGYKISGIVTCES
jgi:hypothetical protein